MPRLVNAKHDNDIYSAYIVDKCRFSGIMYGMTIMRETRKSWLAEQLRTRIESGHLAVGQALESERQLSERYGVSRVTVRAALDLLEGQSFIERQPGRGAMVLDRESDEACHNGTDTTIVFARFVANSWTSALGMGIASGCEQHNCSYRVLDAGGSHERMQVFLRQLPDQVKAAVFVPYGPAGYCDAIESLVDRGVMVVCVERRLCVDTASSVTVDNYTGGYLATHHLLQQRMRPVIYVGTTDITSTMGQRYAGWRAALAEHGIGLTEDLCFDIGEAEETLAPDFEELRRCGYQAAVRIFDTMPPEDGGWSLFALKDQIACGIYDAAVERNLRIGDDVAVVGFGDSPLAARLSPGLTSIRKPPSALGLAAANLICTSLASGRKGPMHEVLPVSLVVRESSGSVRA